MKHYEILHTLIFSSLPCSILSCLFEAPLAFAEKEASTCDASDETCASTATHEFSRAEFDKLIDKIGCHVKRVDAQGMDAIDFARAHRDAGVPLIIRNWTDEWPAHKLWQDGGFVNRFGHVTLTLKLQVVPDEDRAQGYTTLKSFADTPSDSMDNIIFETGDWAFWSELGNDILPLPRALKGANADPVYSIGRNGTGSSVHRHNEAWISQVVGTKVWILAPDSIEEDDLGDQIRMVNPCDLLLRLGQKDRGGFVKEIQVCAVNPGETIYVPKEMHHGTCNIGDITVGIGARGDSTGRPDVIDLAGRCNFEGFKARVEANPKALKARDPVTGMQVIHMASFAGCVSIVEYLIGTKEGETKVDVDAKDLQNDAPIELACEAGRMEVLRAYGRRYGFDKLSETEPLLENVIRSKWIDAATVDNVIKTLIQERVDVTKQQGALIKATELDDDFRVAEFLLDYMPKEVHSAVLPGKSYTLLHSAVKHNKTRLVRKALESGAPADDPPEKMTGESYKSIHLAAGDGHREIVEILLKHRADLQAKSKSGETPLDLAVSEEQEDLVTWLESLQE
eukprot:TRINITY_DN3191_c0_g3_i4.p1 TRINITY_DN3191_c0_g3~~TRINITY_DN3191_c0_g3_i4.p1  ORF type:complete len:566 (+),score=78.11 TRINITY_DN3191_c0_g3_i4:49-1746(+)